MRRIYSALLLSVTTPALVGLPTVTLPAAAAHSVAAHVNQVALTGVESSALAETPAPEQEPAEVGSGAVGAGAQRASRAARLSPVAVTRRLTTSAFSAVGVTWTADAAVTDVAVQVRTHSAKGWSAWRDVEVEGNGVPDTGAEARGARAGSDPVYVGPSDGVQVRVDSGSVRPRDLQLSLIDPGTSAADETAAAGRRTLGGSQAQAAVSRPSYVSRAGWGANESYRTCTPTAAATIKGGILHTTATGNDYTAAEAPAVMRSMYAYHTRSLGWCDIGYNFLVDKFGTLYEGRYGGVDRALVGSHTGGFNTGTFGVSMIGNHDLVAPTAAQLRTVERVFAWKLAMYGRDPQGTTTYTSGGGSATRYAAGTLVTKPVISGHRDYSTKSCPGNLAYPLLPQIRAAVAELMAGSAGTTSVQPPVTKVAAGLTLAAAPASLTAGATTTLSGTLTAGSAPLAGRRVELHARASEAASWTLLTTATTGPTGAFSFVRAPIGTFTYAVRFTGETGYAAAEAKATVTVTPKPAVKVATSITAVGAPTVVTYGSRTTLRGTLRRTSGTALAAKPVKVYVRYGSGAWALAGTVATASNGSYVFAHAPKANATYGVRFQADAANLASARNLTVRVAPKVSTRYSSLTTRVGRTIRVTGTVSPARAGQLVQRQQRVGSVWKTVATARLSAKGAFSFSVTPSLSGRKYYRVVRPATATLAAGVGTTRTLTVR